MKSGNKTIQKKCVEKHTRFLKKLRVKLFQTQETIPRILAVYFNMMPSSFWRSFDQEITLTIPLITAGPIEYQSTWESWIYGVSDQHTTLIYPWITYFWICILGKKGKTEMAKEYFKELDDFHSEPTIYSVYDPETLQPVNRAFLKSDPAHSITLAMYLFARDICEEILVNEIAETV
jgi:hypothetical protein